MAPKIKDVAAYATWDSQTETEKMSIFIPKDIAASEAVSYMAPFIPIT